MALIGGSGEMDATKQDLVADIVQKEIAFAAKLAPTCFDVSRFAVKGAETIAFPKLASFTAEERAAGAALTEQVISSTSDVLALNKRVGVHYVVDPDENVESVLDFELEAAQRAASAHGRKVDTDIISVLEADGEALGTTGDITRDLVLDMREYLISNEADVELNGFLLVSADQEKALLKIDEFSRQDIYGPNAVVRSGMLGTLYGMPVIRHTGLSAQTYYMYVREGVALGFQRRPVYGTQPAVEYGATAMKSTLNQKYGVKSMQVDEGSASAGKSAFIIKDGN